MIIITQRSRSVEIYYNKINNCHRSLRLLWNEFIVSVHKASQWSRSVERAFWKVPCRKEKKRKEINKKKTRREVTFSLALASINFISQTK